MSAAPQRTDAWFHDRAGIFTASRMKDVMAFSKRDGKPLKARADYAIQIAAERHTGIPKDSISAAPLRWGEEVEPAARQAYMAKRGVIVRLVGFQRHPAIPYVGASPDFLVGEDGGGEIKCPFTREEHLETLVAGVPEEHLPQIQCGLWVTARKWWDFVSFHPEFPAETRLYIERVPRDDDYIARMAKHCETLEADVQRILSHLQQKAA